MINGLVRLATIKRSLSLRAYGLFFTWYVRLCGGACGARARVEGFVLFKYPPHSGITIGDDASIGKNVVIDVPPGAKLLMEDRVKLNMDIVVAANNGIYIGQDTLVGEFTSIRDSDHGMALDAGPMQYQPMLNSPVHIGRDVWLGRGVAVLKGAHIGDGCVVAANAVVREGRYASKSILGGIPARVLKERQ